jgi:uncharacterized membrane protein
VDRVEGIVADEVLVLNVVLMLLSRKGFGVYVPKYVRFQTLLLFSDAPRIWKISVSPGIRGFGTNGALCIIGKLYSNSPSTTIPAVVRSKR